MMRALFDCFWIVCTTPGRAAMASGYAACFAQKSDYITFNGVHLRGRAENAELHASLFRSVLKGTKLSAEIESIEVLSAAWRWFTPSGAGAKKAIRLMCW